MTRHARALPPLVGAALLLAVSGCAGPAEPEPQDPSPTTASASATPHPIAAPEGSVLAGAVTLTDADGARLDVLMVVEEPVDGDDGRADPVIERLVADCPGEYSSQLFDDVDAKIVRVDLEVVAQRGTWKPTTVIGVRPAATDSTSLGLTGDDAVMMTGEGTTPRCRRTPVLTGAGSGHLYLVLTGSTLDWRSLPYGVTAGSGTTASDCRFAVPANALGKLVVTTSSGCVARVTAS